MWSAEYLLLHDLQEEAVLRLLLLAVCTREATEGGRATFDNSLLLAAVIPLLPL